MEKIMTQPIDFDNPPVNFARGANSAKEFVENVNAIETYGKYWVLQEEANFEYIHLETNMPEAKLFKSLKAFGITNSLDFAYCTATQTLYVPYKLAELVNTEANPDRIKGVFEYICGALCYMLKLNYPANKPFQEAYEIKQYSEFTGLQNSKTFAIRAFGPKDLTAVGVKSDTYDTSDGRVLHQLCGPINVDAVSIATLGRFDSESEWPCTCAFTITMYVSPDTTGDMRGMVMSAFYALDKIFPDVKLAKTTPNVQVVVCREPEHSTIELVPRAPEATSCSEAARLAFCETFNFHIKGMKSTKFLTAKSIKSEYDDDPIAQELYKTVPEFYKDIDLSLYNHLLVGIANAEIKTAMFFGESGTGKSTIARAIFNTIGLPYAVLNCSVNIEESDIVGTMIPNPHKASADDPEFVWKDGILTTAARNGYGIVIEEINFARPGVLGLLNSLLDDAHTLYLPNGESVIAHPNFRMIATGNLGYEGTNRLNAALVNRFNIIHTFDTMTETETLAAVEKRTGFTNRAQLKKLYAACSVLRKYIKDQNLTGTVSLRQILNLVSCGKYYDRMDNAFVDIVLQGALLEYPEYMEEFRSTVLKSLGLDFALEIQED